MTAANGLEQRSGRRVLRGPSQLPKVAQNPARGPPWRKRHPARHPRTSGCRPPAGSARCGPSPRPPPRAAGRGSRGRGGHSHGGRGRAPASRPWPRTHAVAPSNKDVLHLQGRRDRFRRSRSPHEHRQILRRLPVLAQSPLRHGPTRQSGGRLTLDLAGAPARLVRPDPSQGLQRLLGVPRWGNRSHGTEQVVHVVPVDPMPGRGLDLATDQLVLPESSDQLVPVPRGKHRRHSPVPGPAGVSCPRTAARTRLSLCSLDPSGGACVPRGHRARCPAETAPRPVPPRRGSGRSDRTPTEWAGAPAGACPVQPRRQPF